MTWYVDTMIRLPGFLCIWIIFQYSSDLTPVLFLKLNIGWHTRQPVCFCEKSHVLNAILSLGSMWHKTEAVIERLRKIPENLITIAMTVNFLVEWYITGLHFTKMGPLYKCFLKQNDYLVIVAPTMILQTFAGVLRKVENRRKKQYILMRQIQMSKRRGTFLIRYLKISLKRRHSILSKYLHWSALFFTFQ